MVWGVWRRCCRSTTATRCSTPVSIFSSRLLAVISFEGEELDKNL